MKNITLLVFVILLSACTTFSPNFQKPQLKVVSITPTGNTGLSQDFDIGLSITNPNAKALNLVGMSYKLELDGFDVLSGVTNQVPSIAAYTEQRVNVKTSINLFQGAKLIKSLIDKAATGLTYKVTAKLDTGMPLIGKVPVVNTGTLDLSDLQQ